MRLFIIKNFKKMKMIQIVFNQMIFKIEFYFENKIIILIIYRLKNMMIV